MARRKLEPWMTHRVDIRWTLGEESHSVSVKVGASTTINAITEAFATLQPPEHYELKRVTVTKI